MTNQLHTHELPGHLWKVVGEAFASCKGLQEISFSKSSCPLVEPLVSVSTSSPGSPRRHRHAGGSYGPLSTSSSNDSRNWDYLPPAQYEKRIISLDGNRSGIFNLRPTPKGDGRQGHRSSIERLMHSVYLCRLYSLGGPWSGLRGFRTIIRIHTAQKGHSPEASPENHG